MSPRGNGSISTLDRAIALAERVQPELLHSNQMPAQAELHPHVQPVMRHYRRRERADEEQIDAERIDAAERENDTLTSRLVALLDHGETLGLQAGHCPLCGAERSSEELAAAIQPRDRDLSARGFAQLKLRRP